MKLTVLVLWAALLLAGPASAATIWDVEYFKRGDVSAATTFYDDGAYAFLLTPNYISVYVLNGDWVFLGHYGAAPLPADMPAIVFPIGTDAASAVPLFATSEPLTAVPEPPTWLLILAALGALGTLGIRRSQGRPGPRHERVAVKRTGGA